MDQLHQGRRVKLGREVAGVVHRVPPALHRVLPDDLRADLRRRLGLSAPGDLDFEARPPEPGPAETAGPPDFVQLGAVNAGSRWWFDLMVDHPDVVTRGRPEESSRYFSRFCTEEFGRREIEQFHLLFPRPPGTKAGHWCPDGLAYTWIAPLLARAAPSAAGVVLVRDPIERLRAGLVTTAERGVNHVGSILADAVDRGRYGEQLGRLFASVPPERVQVVQFEQCLVDPLGELARTYRFLDLDASYRPLSVRRTRLDDSGTAPPLDPGVSIRLREVFAPDVIALRQLVPELDLSLWPNFSDLA